MNHKHTSFTDCKESFYTHSMTTETCTVFVDTIPGVSNLHLLVPLTTSIPSLKQQIRSELPTAVVKRASISSSGGVDISNFSTVAELLDALTISSEGEAPRFMNLKLRICLCGGKGGFGHMLKQGAGVKKGKKNGGRAASKDLYKTLDGRRVKAIRDLKKLEEHIEGLPEEQGKKLLEKKEKLKRVLDLDLGKNVRFEDTAFLEDVEKQVEEIRGAMELDDLSDEEEEQTHENKSSNPEDAEEDGVSGTASSSTSIPASSSTTNSRSKKASFKTFFDDDN